MKFIIYRWKKNFKRILIIVIGMIIGTLAISLGFSFFEDALSFSNEITNGNSKVKEAITFHPQTDNKDEIITMLDIILNDLNKEYQVSVGSTLYPIDKNASLSDAPSIVPILYNKKINWRPNLIYGRHLTIDESLSDEKITVIGYDIYKYYFKDKEFNNNMTLNIFGEDYYIVGVVGRTKRYAPQNAEIQIPYKNYFNFFIDEGNAEEIPISLLGNIEFNLSECSYEGLTSHDKVIYTNDIRVPVKLIFIIGILLLITTSVNESNLFSLWIISRKKEIAIKKALGATNLNIIIEMLKETILLSLISIMISLLLQYIIQTKLNSILMNYELRITTINFIVAVCLSIVIALSTTLIPIKIILSTNACNELK